MPISFVSDVSEAAPPAKPTSKPAAKKVTTPKVTTPKPTKPPKPNEEGKHEVLFYICL